MSGYMLTRKAPKVYLAGGIAGLTYAEANQWRDYVRNVLEPHGIECVSPMRGKQTTAGDKDAKFTNQGYNNNPLTMQHGIVTRDRFDVRTSDVVLMNLLQASNKSIGSIVELGWADAFRIPVVTVLDLTDTTNPHTHAFVRELSGFIVPTVEQAVQVVLSLLNKVGYDG